MSELPAPPVLVLAGSEPLGRAGLQADLRHLAWLGRDAIGIPSCLTHQTENGGAIHPVPDESIRASLDAVGAVGAFKIGALHRVGVVAVLEEFLRESDVTTVLDPVLASSRGLTLLDDPGRRLLLERLLPRIDLLTPNLPEACQLAGRDDPLDAARALVDRGARAVFLKGGHREDRGNEIIDHLVTPDEVVACSHARLPGTTLRGTGCAMATLLAHLHAPERPWVTVIEMARKIFHQWWERALDEGQARI